MNRTPLLFVAFAIRDVADALGKTPITHEGNMVLSVLFLACVVMDVIDFLRKKE